MIMKNKIIFIALVGVMIIAACSSEQQYSTPPKEVEQSVNEFFAQRGEQSAGISARQYSNEIYLIKASTVKADGWGLVAQKVQQNGQVSWKIDIGSKDKLKELGINSGY